MRVLTIAAIAAITLGLGIAGSAPAFAQSDSSTHTTKRIFGYQDSHGVFHALSRSAAPDPEVTTRLFTGTLEVDVTITLQTRISTTTNRVLCEADFTAASINNESQAEVDYEETAMAPALPGKAAVVSSFPAPATSPQLVTCKILIPYSWTLVPPGPGYTTSLQGDLSLTIVSVNTTTGAETPIRSNGQSIVGVTFPDEPNAGTTKYAVKATL